MRKRRISKPRKRRPLRNIRNRVPPLPTLLGLNSNIARLTLRTGYNVSMSYDESQKTYPIQRTTVIIGDLLKPSSIEEGYQALTKMFAQVKVHHITCWVIPQTNVTINGFYSAAFVDYGEYYNNNKSSYDIFETESLPGSRVQKISAPMGLQWYPTEPKDRNWISLNFSSDAPIATFVLSPRASTTVYNINKKQESQSELFHPTLEFNILYQIRCSMRGYKDDVKARIVETCFSDLQSLDSCSPSELLTENRMIHQHGPFGIRTEFLRSNRRTEISLTFSG